MTRAATEGGPYKTDMRLLSAFIAFALAAPLSLGGADEPTKELAKLEKQLKAAHANVGPAIACVVVSRSDKYPKPAKRLEPGRLGGFDRDAFLKAEPGKARLADRLDLSNPETIPDHGFAGGIVIDSAGLVLTNYHTIDGATKIYVHIPGGTGSYADLHAADARSDLAVLKLLTPPADMKPVRFGKVRLPDFADDAKANVFPGKLALAMAFPYRSGAVMDRPTAGLGHIAKVRFPTTDPNRNMYSIYNYAPLLEFDSHFNPGVSGAALLNLDGDVIGLTTATATLPSNEHSDALPTDENLTRIIEVLRRGEEVEYGFLGVSGPTRDPFGRNVPKRGRGIPIVSPPTPGSPAALAKLMHQDLITHINDHPVGAFEDLLHHIGSGLAGRKIKLRVERANRTLPEIEIALAKFKNEMPYLATVRPEPAFGLRVDYASVILPTLINPFGGRNANEIPNGVYVRELVPDSPAAAKFKALGESNRWIVSHVNGVAVFKPADFYKEAKGQKAVTLTVFDPTDGMGRREITLP